MSDCDDMYQSEWRFWSYQMNCLERSYFCGSPKSILQVSFFTNFKLLFISIPVQFILIFGLDY